MVYDYQWNYIEKLKYTNYQKSITGLYGLHSLYDQLYFTAAPNGIISGILGEIKGKTGGSGRLHVVKTSTIAISIKRNYCHLLNLVTN